MTVSKSTINNFESSYIGKVEYERSVQIQQSLLDLSRRTGAHYVIGLEHPAVLTLGYRAQREEEITETDLPVVRISRGGLATVHSEGQLVIYPVVNLRELAIGPRDYVCLLLKTTQRMLKEIGVECQVDEQAIGLYTKRGKIAFCGIQIRNGISQHGLSLNVRNDLSLFSGIRACGVQNASFDSLASYGISHTLAELYQVWSRCFEAGLAELKTANSNNSNCSSVPLQ